MSDAATGSRIALFLHRLEGGGAQRMLVELAREFAARGHAVDILAANGSYSEHFRLPESVRLIDLRAKRMVYSFLPLRRYLRSVQPDVLMSTPVHANVIATLAAAAAGWKPRVFVRHASNLSAEIRYSSILSSFRVSCYLARLLYRRTDGVIAVSQGVADDLIETCGLNPSNVHVLPNPTFRSEISALQQEPADLSWLPHPGRPMILAVGRLARQKDFPTLIRAFRLVRDQRLTQLAILGEGPERPQLEKLVEELDLTADVVMPGFVQNPYSVMSHAEAFVLSSVFEGSPNVLVEALACGAQIVATDCPSGPREILGNGSYGTLVPIGDHEALAREIVAALDSPRDKEELRSRAMEFSSGRSADEYLKVLLSHAPQVANGGGMR